MRGGNVEASSAPRPRDMAPRGAAAEARRPPPSSGARRNPLVCFSHDPARGRRCANSNSSNEHLDTTTAFGAARFTSARQATRAISGRRQPNSAGASRRRWRSGCEDLLKGRRAPRGRSASACSDHLLAHSYETDLACRDILLQHPRWLQGLGWPRRKRPAPPRRRPGRGPLLVPVPRLGARGGRASMSGTSGPFLGHTTSPTTALRWSGYSQSPMLASADLVPPSSASLRTFSWMRTCATSSRPCSTPPLGSMYAAAVSRISRHRLY